ncbi:MAG: hypothetical protein ABJG86_14130 [Nitratireductor sp.]
MLYKATFGAAAIIMAATMATPIPGWAQVMPRGPCGAREEIVQWLDERHQEYRAGFGLAGDRALFELFTSRDGTWTLILTGTTRRSCLMAAGTSWEMVDRPAEQSGEATGGT